ncbi:MAG TPA: ferrous iron transport protein B [Abditibacteriaceae bacterium]|jgi:ferrous iron transport protein B
MIDAPPPPAADLVVQPSAVAQRRIALAGNPNAGKTTLFNALTGLRHKVGNYPGVTVEKKEGRADLGTRDVQILDLPGTYSLTPKSPDEEIARDVLLGLRDDTEIPEAVLIVLDASNLERNLYFATQVLELGIPAVVALNMIDVAKENGKPVDARALSASLGVPVVPIIASRGEGLDELKAVLAGDIPRPNSPTLKLPPKLATARDALAKEVRSNSTVPVQNPEGVALRLLCGNVDVARVGAHYGADVAQTLAQQRDTSGVPVAQLGALEAGARYTMLADIVSRAIPQSQKKTGSFSDKADAILTHKVWGLAIFGLITLLVFQAIFSFASIPMDWIDGGVGALGASVEKAMPAGPLRDLLVHGVIAGVGAVVIFLPQIMILFLFIGLLEDTGYMARAAFLMDRLMSRVGLHGRAFIPLLSSFACAIPGIMAARTISSRRDRMTTILIAPFMTCSARLPVYTLMIATFIPNTRLFGVFSTRALTMFGLYVAGIVAAMAAAWVFKKTLFKGPPPALMLELPPYKVPIWRNVIFQVWERGSQFLKRAGTVILAISIVLWAMLSYPKIDLATFENTPDISPAAGIRPGPNGVPPIVDEPEKSVESAREERLASAQLRNSFAGRIGHAVEPLIAPLGFNWKIGIGLIGAMSAREVFVSTIGTVYSVGEADETSTGLKDAMKNDRWPDGRKVWTPLVAVSLMVYFVLAMQCIATLAIVRRETNSWRWPLFMLAYMTGAAWLCSFLVYNIGRSLGWS